MYRDKYPSDEYETTEEMKAGYRKRVEDFLTAVGRGDLVEAGLTPNSYLWNESDTPSFSCDFPEFKVSAMARGMTLGLKLPGVKEMGTEELKTLLGGKCVSCRGMQVCGDRQSGVRFQAGLYF